MHQTGLITHSNRPTDHQRGGQTVVAHTFRHPNALTIDAPPGHDLPITLDAKNRFVIPMDTHIAKRWLGPKQVAANRVDTAHRGLKCTRTDHLSLIHISEPTRLGMIS